MKKWDDWKNTAIRKIKVGYCYASSEIADKLDAPDGCYYCAVSVGSGYDYFPHRFDSIIFALAYASEVANLCYKNGRMFQIVNY